MKTADEFVEDLLIAGLDLTLAEQEAMRRRVTQRDRELVEAAIEALTAVRKTVALNRGQSAEVLAHGVESCVDAFEARVRSLLPKGPP